MEYQEMQVCFAFQSNGSNLLSVKTVGSITFKKGDEFMGWEEACGAHRLAPLS